MRACAGLPDPASLHPSRPRSPASSANSSRIDECTLPSTPPPLESRRLASNSGRPCSDTYAGAFEAGLVHGVRSKSLRSLGGPAQKRTRERSRARRTSVSGQRCVRRAPGPPPMSSKPLGSQPAARPRTRSVQELTRERSLVRRTRRRVRVGQSPGRHLVRNPQRGPEIVTDSETEIV
jgi:hypothetical protein